MGDRIQLGDLTDLYEEDAKKVIGKKIAKIYAHEYRLVFVLDDGVTIESHGCAYDGCSLGVEVYDTEQEYLDS